MSAYIITMDDVVEINKIQSNVELLLDSDKSLLEITIDSKYLEATMMIIELKTENPNKSNMFLALLFLGTILSYKKTHPCTCGEHPFNHLIDRAH